MLVYETFNELIIKNSWLWVS